MTSTKGEKKMARKTRKTNGGAVKRPSAQKPLSEADLADVTGGAAGAIASIGRAASPSAKANPTARSNINETYYASNGPIPNQTINRSNTNVTIKYEYSPSNRALDRNISMGSLTVTGNNDKVKIY
jgi:hypothetical protein